MTPVAPGGVIGIMGGGQLGRMLALAAARLGLKTHIYAPAGENVAADVATNFVAGSDNYLENLDKFARACDVITYEFENVPLAAATEACRYAPLFPSSKALETAQDRLIEKSFLRDIGLKTVNFWAVSHVDDLRSALAEAGGDGILKTRRLGYDGHGQVRIGNNTESLDAPIAQLNKAPAILEALAPFQRELSVVAVRGGDGEIRCYDPAMNIHENGILRRSVVSDAASPERSTQAHAIAARILDRLNYVGVIGIELFEMPDGELWVNEIAPRVHNTGHWTLEACIVSQFENHIRAICGWPLGSTERHSDAEMINLLGEDANQWAHWAAGPHTAVHHYGKSEARTGRKMGHVTRLGTSKNP